MQEKIRNTSILFEGNTPDKVYYELRGEAIQEGISETDFKREYDKIVARAEPILDDIARLKKEIKDKIKNSNKKLSKGDINKYCENGKALGLSYQFIKVDFIPSILKNYSEDFSEDQAESDPVNEDSVIINILGEELVIQQSQAGSLEVKQPIEPISVPIITDSPRIEEPEVIKGTEAFPYNPKEIWAWIVGVLLIILLGWYIYYKSFPTPKPIVTEIDNTETQKSHPTNIETEFKNSIITKTNIKQLINEIKFNKDNIDDTKSLDASTELAEILKNYKLMDEDKKQLIATKNKIAEQIYSTESLIKIEPNEKKFHQRQILKWQNIESKIEEILKLQK